LLQVGITDPDSLERIKEMPMRPVDFGITDAKAGELRDEARHLFDIYFRDSGPYPQGLALCDM
jgi:hypothetical protein